MGQNRCRNGRENQSCLVSRFFYSWKNQTTKSAFYKEKIKMYNRKKKPKAQKEGESNPKSSTKYDEWWYSELPLKSSLSLFVSNSSVISVSSSSAAENRKLGRPREGDELEGELFLRRSLFEKGKDFEWLTGKQVETRLSSSRHYKRCIKSSFVKWNLMWDIFLALFLKLRLWIKLWNFFLTFEFL